MQTHNNFNYSSNVIFSKDQMFAPIQRFPEVGKQVNLVCNNVSWFAEGFIFKLYNNFITVKRLSFVDANNQQKYDYCLFHDILYKLISSFIK